MGGKGSGRRIWSLEEKRHKVIDMAWDVTRAKLQSEDQDKPVFALPIVLKDMVIKQAVINASMTQEDKAIIDKYIPSNMIEHIDNPQSMLT